MCFFKVINFSISFYKTTWCSSWTLSKHSVAAEHLSKIWLRPQGERPVCPNSSPTVLHHKLIFYFKSKGGCRGKKSDPEVLFQGTGEERQKGALSWINIVLWKLPSWSETPSKMWWDWATSSLLPSQGKPRAYVIQAFC